jgi:hypothetical protein
VKRRAEAKLVAMRERAARLRRRILAAAAIAFVVLWLAILVQMTTGHDPALGPTVTANVRPPSGQQVASGPAIRPIVGEDHGDDHGEDEEEREEAEAGPLAAGPTATERAELEAAEVEELEAEAAELEELEAEELEAATTGQS